MSTGLSHRPNDLALAVLSSGAAYGELCQARKTVLQRIGHTAQFMPVVKKVATLYTLDFPDIAPFTYAERWTVAWYLYQQTSAAREDYTHCLD